MRISAPNSDLMLIELLILLSVGYIYSLAPLLIIIILIVAAAGATRGYSIFNLFGIATLAGIGTGRGSMSGRTAIGRYFVTVATYSNLRKSYKGNPAKKRNLGQKLHDSYRRRKDIKKAANDALYEAKLQVAKERGEPPPPPKNYSSTAGPLVGAVKLSKWYDRKKKRLAEKVGTGFLSDSEIAKRKKALEDAQAAYARIGPGLANRAERRAAKKRLNLARRRLYRVSGSTLGRPVTSVLRGMNKARKTTQTVAKYGLLAATGPLGYGLGRKAWKRAKAKEEWLEKVKEAKARGEAPPPPPAFNEGTNRFAESAERGSDTAKRYQKKIDNANDRAAAVAATGDITGSERVNRRAVQFEWLREVGERQQREKTEGRNLDQAQANIKASAIRLAAAERDYKAGKITKAEYLAAQKELQRTVKREYNKIYTKKGLTSALHPIRALGGGKLLDTQRLKDEYRASPQGRAHFTAYYVMRSLAAGRQRDAEGNYVAHDWMRKAILAGAGFRPGEAKKPGNAAEMAERGRPGSDLTPHEREGSDLSPTRDSGAGRRRVDSRSATEEEQKETERRANEERSSGGGSGGSSGSRPPGAEDYAALGLTPDATDAEVRSAYRQRAREFHPDTGGETADPSKFKEATDAYHRIIDYRESGSASGGTRGAAEESQARGEEGGRQPGSPPSGADDHGASGKAKDEAAEESQAGEASSKPARKYFTSGTRDKAEEEQITELAKKRSHKEEDSSEDEVKKEKKEDEKKGDEES